MVTTSFIGNKKPLPAIEKRLREKPKLDARPLYIPLLHHQRLQGCAFMTSAR
jgi:hypothetical protein